MAYDVLKKKNPHKANKEYVKILHFAAYEGETGVDDALRLLFNQGCFISFEAIKEIMSSATKIPSVKDVFIDDVNLDIYDHLLSMKEVV